MTVKEVCDTRLGTRAVACVNALAGYNPEAVRDALKIAESVVDNETCICPAGSSACDLENLRKALKNLKEKQ